MKRIRVVVTQDDINQSVSTQEKRRAWLRQPPSERTAENIPTFVCPGMLAIARTLGVDPQRVWVSALRWSLREGLGVAPDDAEVRRRGPLSEPLAERIVKAFDLEERVNPGTFYIYEETK